MPPEKRFLINPIRPGASVFWMLNDASTVADKIALMRRFRAGGFESAALHCRSGNLVPYASREWFEMIAALVEEGRRLEMDIWLYDEDPYPSGAAGGLVMGSRPDLKARGMAWHRCPPGLRPGSLWRISEHPVLWAGLVPDRSGGSARDLTDQVGPVRSDWFMCEWDSRSYYEETPLVTCPRGDAVFQRFTLRVPEIPAGYHLGAVTIEPVGADSIWGSLPDLLNPDTFPVFRALTLDRYQAAVGAHYGKTIPGIFTDEAKPNGTWPVTPGMWEDFQARCGYDLRPCVWRLFGEPRGREDVQVRLDYRRWMLQRFLDVFVWPYRRYCDSVGLRLIGHFSPEDDPIDETRTVVSVMPVMRAMGSPGTDLIIPLVGDARAPTLNLGSLRAASVRAHLGVGYSISESLGLAPWGIKTREARRILAWQKVLGIDRFFIHGFYMSSEGVQNYEAPPDYGPHNSIFAGMCELNAWLKRVEGLMDGGADAETPVAVLNSLYSFWSAGETRHARLYRMRTSLWRVLLSALSAQVGIHLVDESELNGDVQAAEGSFQVGAKRYRVLLVPDYDILGQPACAAMHRLAAAGVRIVHFGGGAAEMLPERGRLKPIGDLPGERRREGWPSVGWCRRELPRQVVVSGADAENLFVRRFRDRQGRELLLAVNLCEEMRHPRIAAVEAGMVWKPLETDGDIRQRGRETRWAVPGGGCGLFALEAGTAVVKVRASASAARPLAVPSIAFARLDPNVVRLCRTTVTRPGARRPLALPYPQPYWRCSDDYRATREFETFSGRMPLESRPDDAALTYRFDFSVAANLTAPLALVLDPRCARGCCDVRLNGQTLRRALHFPIEHIHPLRLPLRRALRTGRNRLEVAFALESALDGLLSQLYIEGNFHLDADGGRLRISAARPCHDPAGWQRAGLPHYMGRGRYRWVERLAATELAAGAAWTLELDEVIDSAECVVNGRSMGTRAWAPWRWTLSGLKPGENRFELVVAGTAGNLRTLEWPDQPQGWIGGGRLIRAAT